MSKTKGSVSIHKKGRYILPIAENAYAAEVLREITERNKIDIMCQSRYYGMSTSFHWKKGKVEIYNYLGTPINDIPIVKILKEYGLEVKVSDTLANYMKKEYRRQKLESTPLPIHAVDQEIPLFERCVEGITLLCKIEFKVGGVKKPLFEKGKRYLITGVGAEGTESVKISTVPMGGSAVISDQASSSNYTWSLFDESMDTYFTDSDDGKIDKDITQIYPEFIEQNKKKLMKMPIYPLLYEHVAVDAINAANKRGVMNAYFMRMAKMQPLDSKILSESGWTTMGQTKVGSRIYGSNGQLQNVTEVFPHFNKDVYKVTFSDGSSTECGLEHLWSVNTPSRKSTNLPYKVVRLMDIKDDLTYSNGNSKYYIPMVQSMEFSKKELPLDPYVLGLLLGDGCLRTGGSPMFTTADTELVSSLKKLLPNSVLVNKVPKREYEYRLVGSKHGKNELIDALRKFDLITGSDNKLIPEVYKFGSIQQRIDLLAGLLDTDGTIWFQEGSEGSSVIEYTSVSKKLILDVQELIQSLGGIAKLSSSVGSYKKEDIKIFCKTAYKLRIKFVGTFNPFKLKRKADRYQAPTKFYPTRAITSVEYVGKKDCQCIMVDSEDNLYVTDDYILTHNSSFGIAMVEMQGSKKVMIGSPNNARLMWLKEFERMKFTKGKDYIEVNSLKDLKNPAKYHLMTFGWMRQSRDPAYKDRRDWNNLLKPSTRTVKTKDSGTVVVKLTNDCPHCSKPMERLVQADILDENGLVVGKDANHRIWTTARGYICRNRKCSWTETICKGKGAAWHSPKKARSITHTGGYVDFELAKHANCDDKRIQGRLCPTCGTADAVWQPGRYKRIARKYTSAIIDEAHAGKDDSSATYTAISSIRTRRRQALTGTPIANSPMDIYWVLHWALRAPNMQFPFSMSAGEKEFDFQYCDQITLEKTVTTTPDKDGKTQTVVKKVRKRIPYLKNPPEFWEFTAPKIIRRSYNDSLFREALRKANKFMPKVEPLKVSVPMTAEQAALTLSALREFKAAYEKKAEEAASKQQQVNMTQVQNMGQMVTMRTLATCPEYVNEKTGTKVYTGTAGGGKLVEISKIVKEKTATGGKVVILSDFRAMQKTLVDALKSYGVIRFDTDWDDAERMEAFDKFNTDPKVKVFIAGTRAVRESVDFSCADTCICADLLWSPAFQTQAWSRILAPTDRERKCEIIVMMSKNSIDEHIYNVFYGKLVGSEQALDRKSLNKRAKDVDVKWFVNSILEEASQLENFLKDFKIFNSVSRKIDFAAFEERIM